jgi:hemerythrin
MLIANFSPRFQKEQSMDFLKWTEDLSVGNAVIDDDHQRLFDLLERLHLDMASGQINQETQSIVDSLRNYAESHFAREEEFMRKMDYPHYITHQAEHNRFLSEVCALQSRVARGARTAQLDIDQFLAGWLREHVLVRDMALAAAIRGSAVTAS